MNVLTNQSQRSKALKSIKMSENESVALNGNHCLTHLKYKALDMPSKLQSDFVYPDLPSKCTWEPDKSKQPPTVHSVRPL